MKTYHIETYGCQMNVHDSEKLAGVLEKRGYVPAASLLSADVILFNTCCVREHAEDKVFGNVGGGGGGGGRSRALSRSGPA